VGQVSSREPGAPRPASAAAPQAAVLAAGLTAGRRRLAQAGSVVLLLAAWEAASRSGLLDPAFVPAPTAVARALAEIGPTALGLLGETLGKTLVAYVLSVGLGVGVGLVVGSARHLHDVVSPFLVAAYAIPKILVLPWILLALGLGLAPAVAYGTLQGFFPICLLVIGGVRDLDRTPLLVARSMGARPGQIYRKVILPAALPAVLAGMRLGLVFCLLGVLVVEMFGGIRGMGFLLASLATAFRAPALFAATALVSTLSVAGVVGLEALSRRLARWR
jgi:NitT/TauT family transport system permease protein